MIREKYQEYLKSEVWTARRRWKLEEAEHRCQLCYADGEVHVHHRTYERVGEERQDDLIVLCKTCHGKFHDRLPASAEYDIPTERKLFLVGGSASIGPERNLTLLLLRYPHFVETVFRRLTVDEFHNPIYRELYAQMVHLRLFEAGRGEGLAWLRSVSEEAAGKAQELLGDPEGWIIKEPSKMLLDNVRDLKSRNERDAAN